MNPRAAPWLVAALAATAGAVFALGVRLPLPFEGFAVLVAASLAFFGTLAGCLFLPPRWLGTAAKGLDHGPHGKPAAWSGPAEQTKNPADRQHLDDSVESRAEAACDAHGGVRTSDEVPSSAAGIRAADGDPEQIGMPSTTAETPSPRARVRAQG